VHETKSLKPSQVKYHQPKKYENVVVKKSLNEVPLVGDYDFLCSKVIGSVKHQLRALELVRGYRLITVT